MRREIDWLTMEREYRAGQVSVREVGRLCGVDEKTVRRKADQMGWTRDLAGSVAAGVLERVSDAESRTDLSRAREGAWVDEVADRGAAVVLSHQRLLRELRETAELLVHGARAIARDPAGAAKGLLGPKESVGDLMLKAANTLARLVPLERKAFNLDYELDVRELSDEQIVRLLAGRNAP